VNALAIYNLRLGLINRGYYPVPMRDGVPGITSRGPTLPTESAIRSWGGLYPYHLETAIWQGETLVTVVELPPSEAELQARTEAAAASALLNKRTLARAIDRQRKAIRRRLNGVQERSQWLDAHSLGRTKPWLEAGISRATWFRRRRVETDVSGGA
jgi:hypothetical protein